MGIPIMILTGRYDNNWLSRSSSSSASLSSLSTSLTTPTGSNPQGKTSVKNSTFGIGFVGGSFGIEVPVAFRITGYDEILGILIPYIAPQNDAASRFESSSVSLSLSASSALKTWACSR